MVNFSVQATVISQYTSYNIHANRYTLQHVKHNHITNTKRNHVKMLVVSALLMLLCSADVLIDYSF